MDVDTAEGSLKENEWSATPLAARWLAAALAAAGAALLLVAWADAALPAPLRRGDAPPTAFIAETAYDHLLNLTAAGPRVAGSWACEVAAVGVLVAAVKHAAAAATHNRVELDVFTADGAFPLAFLDGMNHVYRGVSGVAARVSGRGAAAGGPALLLNCHYDTVPDSPGASDDGAGCAVLLETLRALAAGPALRRDAVFLFNGAEENVLQGSHGFVTRHRWAGAARAFLNVEACGVGGREVLFQAGPRAPWLVETYAAVAPRPFASSLAQELFRSGLVPADTDFRVFRDFGGLSGLDLAWSADGYAYHTRLDTAARVPPAALQRTGDNVLALARALLADGRLAAPARPGDAEEQPVFFDVLGVWVVTLRGAGAGAAAALALALVALDVRAGAGGRALLARGAWARAVLRAAGATAAGAAAGVAAAAALAAAQAAAGRALAVYARPALLLPLYVLPALVVQWSVVRRLTRARGAAPLRGWAGARAVHCAGGLWAGAALAACLAAGLRSGFLPALWAAGAGAGGLAPRRWSGAARAAAAAAGSLPAALQTMYVAVGSLRMLVPVAGRAGAGPVPADAALAALAAAQALLATAPLLPLAVAARRPGPLLRAMLLAWAGAALAVWWAGPEAAYSAERPQRLMVFHMRRTVHGADGARDELLYWVPELDDNTARTLAAHAPALAAAPVREDCERLVWCGAPYYLPVRSLVARSLAAPAPEPPLVEVAVNLTSRAVDARTLELRLELAGAQHGVVVLAAGAGVEAAAWGGADWVGGAPLEAPRWGARRVYFFALHDARAPRPLALRVRLRRGAGAGAEWAALSVAGHALFGPHKESPAHARLLAALPAWVAATGWGCHLHHYTL